MVFIINDITGTSQEIIVNCSQKQFVANMFINSRTAIAGAIIDLLLVFFYFVVMIFVTTI